MSNDRNEALVHESSFASCADHLAKTFDRRRFVIASAGGMAASMLAPSLAFAAGNPVINQRGSASISAGQTCTWNTVRGLSSTLTIINSSRSNNLIVAVTGAPASGLIVVLNGKMQKTTLDNIFTLPPNLPSYALMATGDFVGAPVKIFNNTDKSKDAPAMIQVVTQ